MQLRAHITVDIDAEDFVAAAVHQRRMEEMLEEMRKNYANSTLSFSERRTRPASRHPSLPVSTRRHTGRLHDYDETSDEQA